MVTQALHRVESILADYHIVNDYKTSLISGPLPFQARFEVRSEEIQEVLDSEWSRLFGAGDRETWSK
jgi:hypothetical protein